MIVGVPQWKSDVTLDFHPAFLHGLAFTGSAHYESARAATDTNTSFAPQYATLDLGIRYASRVLRHAVIARLGAINLTDTHYYSSIADGNIVGSPGADTAYPACTAHGAGEPGVRSLACPGRTPATADTGPPPG